MAKIHVSDHMFRVGTLVHLSWSAPEFKRWHGCGCSRVTTAYRIPVLNLTPSPHVAARALGVSLAIRTNLAFTSPTPAEGLGVTGSASACLLVASSLSVCHCPSTLPRRARHVEHIPTFVPHVRARASRRQPANKSLQRTLGNVAFFRLPNHVLRVGKPVLWSLSAAEFRRSAESFSRYHLLSFEVGAL